MLCVYCLYLIIIYIKLFLSQVILCYKVADVVEKLLPVYEQPESAADYLYATGLPEFTEFTICMRFNGLVVESYDHYLSISNSGK